MMSEKLRRRLDYRTDLIERLIKRSQIRRQIPTRKSVQEGKPDRIADLLDEAADTIMNMENEMAMLRAKLEGKLDAK